MSNINSEDQSDDEEATPNWDLLSDELSGSALAALQQHMENKTILDAATSPVTSEVCNIEGQTTENMMTNMKFKMKYAFSFFLFCNKHILISDMHFFFC